jgi:hypothetical protein
MIGLRGITDRFGVESMIDLDGIRKKAQLTHVIVFNIFESNWLNSSLQSEIETD